MSIFVIDIDFFLNEIGRNHICELTIIYHKHHKHFQIIIHHQLPNNRYVIIQTEKIIENIPTFQNKNENENDFSIKISSLYGLTNMTRLKITNIPHLIELPYFGDSIKLKKLLCYENCLEYLPSFLPTTIDYIDCGRNQLKELPNSMPPQLKFLYCNNNQLCYLPPLSIQLHTSCLMDNPFFSYIGNQYHQHFIKRNAIILQMRSNYYSLKYGWRFFFSILKRRMSKMKKELLEMSAKITMNPCRIIRLLEIYEDLENIIT